MTEFLKSKMGQFMAIAASVGIAASLTGCQLKPRQAQAVAANPAPVVGEVETTKSITVATKQPSAIATKPPKVIFIAIDKTGSAKPSKIHNPIGSGLIPVHTKVTTTKSVTTKIATFVIFIPSSGSRLGLLD